MLTKLTADNLLTLKGNGKATKYAISPACHLFRSIDMEEYYKKEIDEREINEQFNGTLLTDILPYVSIFTKNELDNLNEFQKIYSDNISQLTDRKSTRLNSSH